MQVGIEEVNSYNCNKWYSLYDRCSPRDSCSTLCTSSVLSRYTTILHTEKLWQPMMQMKTSYSWSSLIRLQIKYDYIQFIC